MLKYHNADEFKRHPLPLMTTLFSQIKSRHWSAIPAGRWRIKEKVAAYLFK